MLSALWSPSALAVCLVWLAAAGRTVSARDAGLFYAWSLRASKISGKLQELHRDRNLSRDRVKTACRARSVSRWVWGAGG